MTTTRVGRTASSAWPGSSWAAFSASSAGGDPFDADGGLPLAGRDGDALRVIDPCAGDAFAQSATVRPAASPTACGPDHRGEIDYRPGRARRAVRAQ